MEALPSLPSSSPAAQGRLRKLPSLLKALRVGSRLARGFANFWAMPPLRFPEDPPEKLLRRASQLQALCQALLDRLGVELQTLGAPPREGLLVSNHVSFADILVLSALAPTVFVSKAEVARWPIIGAIAASAGTIFIQRQKRSDVAKANVALHRAIQSGLLVTLFPEGTSSDGQHVLPFLPSLLQPAVETQAPVTPAFLRYSNPSGERIDEVAYFGDRHLQDCLWALIERRHTLASVRFGTSLPPNGDRKTLAALLHAEVRSLAALPSAVNTPP